MSPRSPFAFDWVFEHAEVRPEAPAVGTPQHGWTSYAALAGLLRALSSKLADEGVGPSRFVVQAAPAGAVSVAASLAAQTLGAGAVDVNREIGRDALGEILRQTEARVAVIAGRDVALWAELGRSAGLEHLLVVHPSRPTERMEAVLGGLRWTWVPESGEFTHSSAAPGPVRNAPARAHAHAPALLIYTSGSTGVPRGVLQTHANVDANTRAICRYLELGPEDRAMATLPLFYCYGKSVVQTHLCVGGSVFFDHRFMYPRVVMEAIREQRCTNFAGVPLTFESLRRQVDLSTVDLQTLRFVTQAGGAMHPDTVRWARQAFAPAKLFVMYGQTEATARLTYLPPERSEEKRGSVGRALDNVELCVVDDQRRPVATGTVGNVVARGPSITPGYFQAPEETAAILRDGWLWTGDLGRLDEEDFLFLAGRTKEFLKLAGNRVSALEIEEVLAVHPAVHEVAVVAAHDPNGEEQALAFVVPRPDGSADEHELRRHCRELLPAFKVPKYVRFTRSLPRTATGKVAKAELQEWVRRDKSLLEERAAAGLGAEGQRAVGTAD